MASIYCLASGENATDMEGARRITVMGVRCQATSDGRDGTQTRKGAQSEESQNFGFPRSRRPAGSTGYDRDALLARQATIETPCWLDRLRSRRPAGSTGHPFALAPACGDEPKKFCLGVTPDLSASVFHSGQPTRAVRVISPRR